MSQVLKAILCALVGALLGCTIILIAVLTYANEPTGNEMVLALGAGAGVGLVAGAIWRRGAIRWLIEAIMSV
jgi:hypothetical protein